MVVLLQQKQVFIFVIIVSHLRLLRKRRRRTQNDLFDQDWHPFSEVEAFNFLKLLVADDWVVFEYTKALNDDLERHRSVAPALYRMKISLCKDSVVL